MGITTGRSRVRSSWAPSLSPPPPSCLGLTCLASASSSQPHRGAFSLQSFVLHFCLFIPPGEFSLTLSWWTSTQVPHARSAVHLTLRLTSLAVGVGVYQFDTNAYGTHRPGRAETSLLLSRGLEPTDHQIKHIHSEHS